MTPLVWFAIALAAIALLSVMVSDDAGREGNWLLMVAILAMGLQCVIWTVKP